jgi:hypothetical protein
MMVPSERLRQIQELAAQTRRIEQELRPLVDEFAIGRLSARLFYLRLLELRGWTITPAEDEECRKLEREDELDRQERGDWTQRR